jgi:hypothetical protein
MGARAFPPPYHTAIGRYLIVPAGGCPARGHAADRATIVAMQARVMDVLDLMADLATVASCSGRSDRRR